MTGSTPLIGPEVGFTPIIDTHAPPVPTENALSQALEHCARILGDSNVDGPEQASRRYGGGPLPPKYITRPGGAVRPGNRDEVVAVVKIARRFGQALHPISRGQNWGYGGPLPPTDGAIIVDLSRLNRIHEVNLELAYAVIEPGVTQRQLYDFLRENNIPLIPDATGAGPEASIVGNVLQRGFGHTPCGNRVIHAGNFEVVLFDGRIIQTGLGRFPNARAQHVFPYGIGPWIDGLFTQSHLGIVTRMTVWLFPRPERLLAFALKVREDHQIASIVERLRPLCLDGTVRSVVHIANDLRVISAKTTYPYILAFGNTPLPEDVRLRLRRQFGVGAWNLMGGVYAGPHLARATIREIRRAFRGLAQVYCFGERLLGLGSSLVRLSDILRLRTPLTEAIRSAKSVYRLLQGEPTDEHLNGVFWRHRSVPQPVDPSQAGVLWCSPVLPMRGEDVLRLLRVVEPVYARYQLEPLITFSAVTSRALVGVFSVCYDPQDSTQVALAEGCYDELNRVIREAGYYPYRGMIPRSVPMNTPSLGTDDLEGFLAALKCQTPEVK